MKCECSLNYNYEVIGLCDISKFGFYGQIGNNESWTQITIPEILTIPRSKPNIESIDKIYIKVNIEQSRIISTPKTAQNITSVEGLKLTGRKLLVDGYICQTIVYTAATCTQTVHSASFKVPFSTFIVIDAAADIDNDKYCVKACIEDVFSRPLNPRTIFKNVTLFLHATKSQNPACAQA